jgi:beta-galactosidase
MRVEVGHNGLLIDGREVPVYSGAMHYWRLERNVWPKILDRVQALGFDMLETYIPWSVHETSPGVFDWGESDPRKDVEAFMRLCEERNVWLLMRPGPLINAELTDFGYPEWVLLDPEVQARTALDSLHLDAAWGLHPPRQFPVPSYASERFYAYVAGWFDAICPIISGHLAPDGCVVAVQSDNETCYLFHDLAYASDYHPDSLRLYRMFLADRYTSVDELNRQYGSEYRSFQHVEPPRDGDIDSRADVPWRIDWVAYKEFQIRWSVARLARMLRERGVDGVPIFHDVAYQYRTPLDLGRLEADPDIDWVGLNLYRPPEEHRPLADRVRFLAGSTRLPFVPELEAGLWAHHVRTALPEEEAFVTLSSLMYGIKAFNFYMLVERERWQGSPITRHGEYRPEYAAFYARLLAFLKRFEFWQFHRRPGAVAALGYDLARYAAASSALDYGHADLLGLPWALFDDTQDLGFRWDVVREAQLREDSWPRRVMDALRSGSVDYDLADTHVASGRLARYPVVFLQTADFMSADDQQPLLEYARNGGALVVGPGMPYLDEYLRPKRVLAEHAMDPGTFSIGLGHLVWATDQDVAECVRRLVRPAEFRADDTRLEVVPHYHEDQTLLFVSNPTPQPIAATLRFEGERTFSTAWAEPRSERVRDELAVELRPYSVEIWAVSR